jgi:hypothetical protein
MKVLFLRLDAILKEFDPLTEVASYDEMIGFFNSFDWKKGEKVIAQKKRLGISSFPQILRFQKDQTSYVELSPKGNEGFYLNCLDGKLVFDTYIPDTRSFQKFSVEEFLQDFWNGNLQEKYVFEEACVSEKADLNSRSRFRVWHFWPVIFFLIGPAIVLVNGRWSNKNIQFLELVTAIFFVSLLPYFILLVHYFRHNGKSELSVSKKSKTITFTKSGQSQTLAFSSITKAKLLLNPDQRSLWSTWGYLLLEAGPKERIVITTFLYKDLEALSEFIGINPMNDAAFYPIVRLRIKSDKQLAEDKNEHQAKVEEFTQRWAEKNKEELLKIVSSPSEYAAYAIEAANILLKKK